MTLNEWVDYREGLREYLVFDRSMSDLAVHRITCEIAMVSEVIDEKRFGRKTKQPKTN